MQGIFKPQRWQVTFLMTHLTHLRLYDLLNTDSMDIEDIIDTILDSDTLSHVKSYYLDRSILGKYLNVLNDSTISLMNETLEDTPTQLDGMIQRIQHFAVSIVKKV